MKVQKKWLHTHPFEPFLPLGATHLIVGTLPPPRFSGGALKKGDVNFSYGSIDGQLWPILERIYGLELSYENSEEAIAERKTFLEHYGIGICDIVAHCFREKIDASDLGMYEVVLRDFFHYLQKVPSVHTLLFTGGGSKNGPEYFFKRYAKQQGIVFEQVCEQIPRKHQFVFEDRILKTYSLIAPSGAANRAVGSIQEYKAQKAKNSDFTTLDFRMAQYKKYFPPLIEDPDESP